MKIKNIFKKLRLIPAFGYLIGTGCYFWLFHNNAFAALPQDKLMFIFLAFGVAGSLAGHALHRRLYGKP